MTGQSFRALKMSKKSILGPSYGSLKKGVAKLAKMPWLLPSLNSCHGHKLGQNSVSIRKPMTRQLFWALRMPKKFIPGPSYGHLKKSSPKIWVLNKAQILTKSKIFNAHQNENCLEIIMGINFWKRYFLASVTDNQSLVPNWGNFAPFLHHSVTFSVCHCFYFHCVLFLVFLFQTPSLKIQDSGLWPSEARFVGQQSLDFLGGVIKYKDWEM